MLSPQNKYIEEHSGSLPEALGWIEHQTNVRTNYPQMLCGGQKGRLLKLLVEMTGACNVLEIGTFTGYSSVFLALGLPEKGHIDTIEINGELEDLIREGWKRAGISDKITLHIGDAIDILSRNDTSYDLAYIDANKREYSRYYDLVIDRLRPGGIIVVDDVLMGGKVLDLQENKDRQTLGLAEFNDRVSLDTRVEVVMLPLHDGLSIIRKHD